MKNKLILYFVLIIIAISLSIFIFIKRINIEKKDKNLYLIYDYNSIYQNCNKYYLNKEKFLNDLKKAGINALAFYEDNLQNLQERGLIKYKTWNFVKNSKKNSIYIYSENKTLLNKIKERFFLLYKIKPIQENKHLLVLPFSPSSLYIPLGFFTYNFKKFKEKGFYIVLRPENNRDLTKNELKIILNDLKYADIILFSGIDNQVLGFPYYIKDVAKTINKYNIKLAILEFYKHSAKQIGINSLAKKCINNLIKVQSITQNKLIRAKPNTIITIFKRGVKERNIKCLYLKLYPVNYNNLNLIQSNLKLIKNLKINIEKLGYKINLNNQNMKTNLFYTIPEKYKIILSILSIFVLLFTINILIKKIPNYIDLSIFILWQIFVLILYKFNLLNKLMPFIIFKIFFTFSIILLIKLKDYLKSEFLIFIIIVITNIIGAIYMQTILYNRLYYLAINQFWGVKLLFLYAIFISIIIYPILKQEKKLDIKNFIKIYKNFFKENIKLWYIIVALFIMSIGFLILLRSGNTGGNISYIELALRNYLEKIFFIRPRFKDIILGPIFIFSIYLLKREKIILSYIFLIISSIYIANIYDSFAHIHTPALIVLIRVIYAILIPFIIFYTLFSLYKLYTYLKRRHN